MITGTETFHRLLSAGWRRRRTSGPVPVQTRGPRVGARGETGVGVGAGVSVRMSLKV